MALSHNAVYELIPHPVAGYGNIILRIYCYFTIIYFQTITTHNSLGVSDEVPKNKSAHLGKTH